MVLLSLGSGLITALMAQAKPARDTLDWSWIADDSTAPERKDDAQAVTSSDKTTFPQ
ncbi:MULTISPECIES: hypothetical protein [Asticcacaulis]|uniref:hypothetical protein n=1 Tax=Asticcacaulis TaxID=76890 RepID=UPI001AE27BF0|nr:MULTISPECIES: hypothetical protein [Asticcacaulis]MBP2159707.1 hypothetical protein [Asticcacaulis solisilvae]MDR6800466.1 hypothetical protein [Asticcacaulis sp. BE141]